MNWSYVLPNLIAMLAALALFSCAILLSRKRLNRDDVKAFGFALGVVVPLLLLVGWLR